MTYLILVRFAGNTVDAAIEGRTIMKAALKIFFVSVIFSSKLSIYAIWFTTAFRLSYSDALKKLQIVTKAFAKL